MKPLLKRILVLIWLLSLSPGSAEAIWHSPTADWERLECVNDGYDVGSQPSVAYDAELRHVGMTDWSILGINTKVAYAYGLAPGSFSRIVECPRPHPVAVVGFLAAEETAAGSKALVPYYPPNQGFAGASGEASLVPGTVVDRYGGTGGSFLSPAGTPVAARSLPFGTENLPLNSYQVMQPINVNAGTAAQLNFTRQP